MKHIPSHLKAIYTLALALAYGYHVTSIILRKIQVWIHRFRTRDFMGRSNGLPEHNALVVYCALLWWWRRVFEKSVYSSLEFPSLSNGS